MSLTSERRRLPTLLTLVVASTCMASVAAATGDRLVFSQDGALSIVSLPASAAATTIEVPAGGIRQIAFLDDGRLLAVRRPVAVEPELRLVEILADGSVIDIGPIAPPEVVAEDAKEEPMDLEVTADGRLYFLGSVHRVSGSPEVAQRLVELDLDDASLRGSVVPDRWVEVLAAAPSGFWAFTDRGLELLDPETGAIVDPGVPGDEWVSALPPNAYLQRDAATDSTGALWTFGERVCSPPCFLAHRFDPATGDFASTLAAIDPDDFFISDLAIDRRCRPTARAACLQGGRFRAEVEWEDFAGTTGFGRAAPAGSADNAIFTFFDPANWELMVKLLDGCGENGHYWVFLSGSTNVGYDLRVTDLETGAVRTYHNPVGRTAVTATDTAAFACL